MAMPVPASIDELVKLIRKSGMVEEARLDAYIERLRLAGQTPTDVRKFAGAMVRDGILTFFQAEQFMLGKWRGFSIGKYKLLERIGLGGMGQVFLCEHMYMRRRVAIKVLPPAKAEDPAALGRFYREARAAAALDHPNIVRTHDIDQDGNLHFLVMEYVDGSSQLELVKKKGPLEIDRAVHYIWQTLHGLDHAYQVGVIHRDIKPGNIMVDRYGVAKILDMGLARFYNHDDDMLTKKYDEKSVLGTADYVAPEQTLNSHDVDIRADIYSLGATFYFLLAGHPPFPDGSISQKLIAHQTRQPTPLRKIRAEVPTEIADIVAKMMSKSVEQRFQTPSEILTLLAPFVKQGIPLPPEDEMPVLSLAARESSGSSAIQNNPGNTGGNSGTFRQDSAILRAEIMQRSGKLAGVSASLSSSGVRKHPTSGSGLSGSGGTAVGEGSSGNMNPPFFEPPAQSPLGSAAMAPIPNPGGGRSMNETARMGQTQSTERTPLIERSVKPAKKSMNPFQAIANPTLRLAVEVILVFGVILGVVAAVMWM
jgi:serine/threonine protein kinase